MEADYPNSTEVIAVDAAKEAIRRECRVFQ